MGLPGWHCLLCSCLFCSVHGVIPKPQNVRIRSRDFDSILLWDPPIFHEENVTYTVEYKRSTFESLCTKTNFTECNITALPLYSNHSLRVRTEFVKEQSEWVDLSFIPLKDTIISPPTVTKNETKNRDLYIEVSGPFKPQGDFIWSMADIYGSSIYNMLIWKKDHEDQIRNVTIRQSSKILSPLDPGTTYCFKIQVFIEELEKGGEWTNKSCITTNNIEVNPVLLAVIIVPVLVLIPFCCILILSVYRRVKYTYFPSYTLPEHFKEFLGKPYFGSDFVVSQPYGDDHVCEKITVVLEEQKHIASVTQPNSAKQQFQTSQEGTTGLKEVEDGTSLLTIQTGGNLLHPEGTHKASADNLHIVDIKTVTL